MPLTDAMFLMVENRDQPMHVGGLQLYDLPAGAGAGWVREFFEQAVQATDIAPLFRRRPQRSLSSLGAWSWAEDQAIDLEHHVRHSALPEPGRVRELLTLVSRLHSTLLDRRRPLWEFNIIEGLEHDRFAVYVKVHHSMMDGVSALRLLRRSLSTDPDDLTTPLPWQPRVRAAHQGSTTSSKPSALSLPLSALRAGTDLGMLGPRLMGAAAHALREQLVVLPSAPPRTIFNGPITGSRRFAAQSWPMDRIRDVAKATGATINDVVLAMCSSALRRYLVELDALPEHPLIAMTPVSLHEAAESADKPSNAVGALLCNLGTDHAEPAERLSVIQHSMLAGKAVLKRMSPLQVIALSGVMLMPMGVEALLGVHRFTRPSFNVVISNVPGPAQPLYWRGAPLRGSYPMSIPLTGQALNITVTSYNGSLDFGITGCRRSAPHLQRLLTFLDIGLEELEALAA